MTQRLLIGVVSTIALAIALTATAHARTSSKNQKQHYSTGECFIDESRGGGRRVCNEGWNVRVASAPVKKQKRKSPAPARTAVATNKTGGIVTVDTAANIRITVASNAADRFRGFIAGLVSRGYRPKRIHCYATGGHVSNSNHYRGMACDFDQSGWGKTAGPMYRVADLAKKWGLRDGCVFRDCGHVDIPPRWAAKPEPLNLYAAVEKHKQSIAR